MPDLRRSPDELLREIQESENSAKRGKLKLFLGASAGVGKTYAMLVEARQLLDRGVDVVIGVAVTHSRKETEKLLLGLPIIPERNFEYRGVMLREFDIDAILLRRPEIVIVDELAHTNVPGSRHPKRWQDVQELLDAGISVYTALNIQHLESLNDVVAQVSGIRVKETVPDAAFSRANEIELVDITPEELRQRVKEGKVYISEQIDHALDGFFKTSNLIALRELSLRSVADQIDAQMQEYRQTTGVSDVWATRDRVLVCIAPNNLGDRVLRTGARIANSTKSQVTALFVESSRQRTRTLAEMELASQALARAEELGIEVARRSGQDIVAEILHFATSKNINLIIVGKPIKPRWKEVCFGSVVDELVRRSGEINVYVISSESEKGPAQKRSYEVPSFTWKDGLTALAFTVGSTLIATLSDSFLPKETIMMIYLLGIALCASRAKFSAAFACSLLSVLAFDFFFVPPRNQLAVSDLKWLPTFAIMLGVGMIISRLTTRLKEEFAQASERERRSAALFDATREMAKARGRENIAQAAARRLSQDVDLDISVLLPRDGGRLGVVSRSRSHFENDHREMPVANWVYDNGKPAGAGTDTLPSAKGMYLPLRTSESTVGVLGVRASIEGESVDANQRAVVDTFASSLALAIERANLATLSAKAKLEVESERLRNSLLSSVSHDIRSPLTAISGAASALMEGSGDAKLLATTIFDESQRLNRHVRDLLDMTRLERGAVKPKLEWGSVEEIVGIALARTEHLFAGRQITTSIPENLPLTLFDSALLEKALVNVIENAIKHTPTESPIEIIAQTQSQILTILVVDHGNGIPAHEKAAVFEKFYRKKEDDSGFGLGLAISKTVMKMNAGDLEVLDTNGGGATFQLKLPITPNPPEVPRG